MLCNIYHHYHHPLHHYHHHYHGLGDTCLVSVWVRCVSIITVIFNMITLIRFYSEQIKAIDNNADWTLK